MKNSLKSVDKLRLKSEFSHVRENGGKIVGSYCLVFPAPSTDGKLRCGVICGRKFSKKAVERNRARRLLWESFRLLKARIKARHMCMTPRRRILSGKMQDVREELERLLAEAGLLED